MLQRDSLSSNCAPDLNRIVDEIAASEDGRWLEELHINYAVQADYETHGDVRVDRVLALLEEEPEQVVQDDEDDYSIVYSDAQIAAVARRYAVLPKVRLVTVQRRVMRSVIRRPRRRTRTRSRSRSPGREPGDPEPSSSRGRR
jgi:hypothetical protein